MVPMNSRPRLAPLLAALLALTLGASVPARPAPAAPSPAATVKDYDSPAAHEARMKWFRQAKFGLFIHWGLYSIPAGYWKGKRSPGIGEWIMSRMKIPVAEYAKLAGGFDPIYFNAEKWVQMAQDAGMKYIVITAKHHDGFAMYHSRVSPFNVYDATPFHRDPIKELAEACARHHMPFGFYYSQSQDWHEPGGMGNNWDFPSNQEKSASGAYDAYLRNKAVPQVKELLSNYGPVCLMWFDTPYEMTAARGRMFIDAVRALQPNTLIDGRLLPHGAGGDYRSTGDNAIPPKGETGDWEVPATMNHTWGFRKDDTDWKSPGEIVFKLVDIVSKGGNYLLNVGPMSNGIIPEECQANLRSVGRWLKVNGEAVYGAGRSPFGAEFGDYAAHEKTRDGKPLFLARKDWRCTTKPGRLYFTVFHVSRAPKGPDAGLVLPAFKNAIQGAYMLGDSRRTPLPVETMADGTRWIRVSPYINDTMGEVVVVDIAGDQVRL